MNDEVLIYMRTQSTDVGVMPAYYVAVGAAEAAMWISDGGVDVSDDDQAWHAYRREVDAYYGSIL